MSRIVFARQFFQKGADSALLWLSSVVKDKPRFNKATGRVKESSLSKLRISLRPEQSLILILTYFPAR
jgi:hypothetical protein